MSFFILLAALGHNRRCQCDPEAICISFQDVEDEIKIMKKLDHPKLIKLYEVSTNHGITTNIPFTRQLHGTCGEAEKLFEELKADAASN